MSKSDPRQSLTRTKSATRLAEVEQALREEVARALKDGYSQAELDAGKQAMLNARRLGRATASPSMFSTRCTGGPAAASPKAL